MLKKPSRTSGTKHCRAEALGEADAGTAASKQAACVKRCKHPLPAELPCGGGDPVAFHQASHSHHRHRHRGTHQPDRCRHAVRDRSARRDSRARRDQAAPPGYHNTHEQPIGSGRNPVTAHGTYDSERPKHPAAIHEFPEHKPRKTVRLDPNPVIINSERVVASPTKPAKHASRSPLPRGSRHQFDSVPRQRPSCRNSGFRPILKSSLVKMDPNEGHKVLDVDRKAHEPMNHQQSSKPTGQQPKQLSQMGHNLAVQLQRNLHLKDVSTQMTPPNSSLAHGTDCSSQYPKEETRSKINTSDEEETTAADVETLTVDSGKDVHGSSPAQPAPPLTAREGIPRTGPRIMYPRPVTTPQTHGWNHGSVGTAQAPPQNQPDIRLPQPGVHPGLGVNLSVDAGSEFTAGMLADKAKQAPLLAAEGLPHCSKESGVAPGAQGRTGHSTAQDKAHGYSPLCGCPSCTIESSRYLKTRQNIHTLPSHLPSSGLEGGLASATRHKLVNSSARTDLVGKPGVGLRPNEKIQPQPAAARRSPEKSWRDILMGLTKTNQTRTAELTSRAQGLPAVVPSATIDVITNAQGDFSQSVSENNTSKDISNLPSSKIDWAMSVQSDRCGHTAPAPTAKAPCSQNSMPGAKHDSESWNRPRAPCAAASSSFLVQNQPKEEQAEPPNQTQKEPPKATPASATTKPTAEELMTAIMNAQKANDVFGRMGIDFTSCWDPRVFQALAKSLTDNGAGGAAGKHSPPERAVVAGSTKGQDVHRTPSRSCARNSCADLRSSRHDETAVRADPSSHSKWGDIMSSQLTQENDSVHQLYPSPGQGSTHDRDNSPSESSRPQQPLNSQTRAVDPTNLYFANLPKQIRDCDLVRLVEEFGPVVSAKLMENPALKLKGVGFVRMRSAADCEKVIRALNGKPFPGTRKALTVKLAWKSKDTDNTSFSGYNNYQSTFSEFTPNSPFGNHGGTTYFGPGSAYGILSPGDSLRQFGLWPQTDLNFGSSMYQAPSPLARTFTPPPGAYFAGTPVPPGPLFPGHVPQVKDDYGGWNNAAGYPVQGMEYYVPTSMDPAPGQVEGAWGLWTPSQTTFEQAFVQADGAIFAQHVPPFGRDLATEADPSAAFYAQPGMPQAAWVNPQHGFIHPANLGQPPFFPQQGVPADSFPGTKPSGAAYGNSSTNDSAPQFYASAQGSHGEETRGFAHPPELNECVSQCPPPGLSTEPSAGINATESTLRQGDQAAETITTDQPSNNQEHAVEHAAAEALGRELRTMNGNTFGDRLETGTGYRNTQSLTVLPNPTLKTSGAPQDLTTTGNGNLGPGTGFIFPHQRGPHTIPSALKDGHIRGTKSEQLTWRSSGDAPQKTASGAGAATGNDPYKGRQEWKLPSYKTFTVSAAAVQTDTRQAAEPSSSELADMPAEVKATTSETTPHQGKGNEAAAPAELLLKRTKRDKETDSQTKPTQVEKSPEVSLATIDEMAMMEAGVQPLAPSQPTEPED